MPWREPPPVTNTSIPQRVGNERRILVSELSGRSNIVAMTTQYNIQHDRELMDKILNAVVSMENEGYQFEAAGATFDLLVQAVCRRVPTAFRAAQVPRGSGERRPGRTRHRSHGQAPGRRPASPRGGRRRWSGQRPRRGPAQGAERLLPQPPRHAVGRLSSACGEFRGRHGRPHSGRHRKRRLDTRSGEPWESARTSSKPVGWPWSTLSSTNCIATNSDLPD